MTTKVFHILTIFAAALAVTARSTPAQSFCALTVVVDVKSGADSFIVELLDEKNRVVSSQRTSGRSVRFCDFGPEVRSIRVGPNECFPTTVSNMRFLFGKEQIIHVFLNDCSGGESLTNACTIVLRIKDLDGHPIPGAIVEEPGRKQTVDEFGRVASAILIRTSRTFVVQSQGFESAKVTLACEIGEILDSTVLLRSVR